MIVKIWLIQEWEAFLVLLPVKGAAIDYNSTDRSTVAANILNHCCPVRKGLAQDGCDGIVHDQQNPQGVADIGDFANGKDLQFRSWQCFSIKASGTVISVAPEGFRISWIDEVGLDTNILAEGVREQVPATSIEVRRGDETSPASHKLRIANKVAA